MKSLVQKTILAMLAAGIISPQPLAPAAASTWTCTGTLDVAGDASFTCGSATLTASQFCGPISNGCTGATVGDGCTCVPAAAFTDNLFITCTCYVASSGNISYELHNTDGVSSRTVHSSYKLRTFH